MDRKICFICKMSATDDVNYGTWESMKNVSVHYFCLLMSSHMEQNGADDEGIHGFLEEDIRKCVQRCASRKCCYCGEKAASIKCNDKSCKRYFHFICGRKNDCISEFSGNYVSRCHQHHGINDVAVVNHDYCFICWTQMGEYNPITSMPSCCDRGWMHAECLRKTALCAGYMFKCPLCGFENAAYVDAMRKRGIYVPSRDASWELESNAFASLHYAPDSCDAVQCVCPRGPWFQAKWPSSEWFLLKCIYCGSKAIHVHCNKHNWEVYECNDCMLNLQRSLNSSQMTQDEPIDAAEAPTTDPKPINYRSQLDIPLIQEDHPSKMFPRDVSQVEDHVENVVEVNDWIRDANEMSALVAVKRSGHHGGKENVIVIAKDLPQTGATFMESQRKLSQTRMELLFLKY